MMELQKVINLLNAALEATIYLAPTDLWLTADELYEVGRRAGFKDGEIGDALQQVATQYMGGNKRVEPKISAIWGNFAFGESPDYHDYAALDFVTSALNAHRRDVGMKGRGMQRSVLVERAASEGISRNGCEAAIVTMRLSGALSEQDGVVALKANYNDLPSNIKGKFGRPQQVSEVRERAHAYVKDIVARRTDGRPKHADALDAFSDALDTLGYAPFRLWWVQTVSEFRKTEPSISPVSGLVLAAALVEGALTFIVTFAKSKNLGLFGSTDYSEEPKKWKVDNLVKSAAMGNENAIFDAGTRGRVDGLIRARQRIHAGRMLSEFPRGVPDLRPEEAKEAKIVAELAVRRVLDWIELHRS